MGRLVQLELENFKSYRGHQIIGPFADLTAIIGPNGAGKSNLMDAISFVLGVSSNQIRSGHLTDLIYRSGNGNKQEIEEDEETHDRMDDDTPDPRSASVMAHYECDNGEVLILKRSILPNSTSEYRLNDQVVTLTRYSDRLAKENILIKARNFLVFQGDVEAMASQNSKALSRMMEQVSGSDALKADYDKWRLEVERTAEASAQAFHKKRGLSQEWKRVKTWREEAKQYEQLLDEKERIQQQRILWQLYEQQLKINQVSQELIQDKLKLQQEENQVNQTEDNYQSLRKEQAGHQKKQLVLERQQQQLQRECDQFVSKQANLKESMQFAQQKLKDYQQQLQQSQRDRSQHEQESVLLQRQLQQVQQAYAVFQQQSKSTSNVSALTASQQQEYQRLKQELQYLTATDQQQLPSLERDVDVAKDAMKRLEEQVQTHQERLTVIEQERDALQQRLNKFQRVYSDTLAEWQRLEQLHTQTRQDHLSLAQQETETNERLAEVLHQLLFMKHARQENERQLKLTAALDALKRIYPGVVGRVSDVCVPKQKQHHLALALVMGRYSEAVIVDSRETAFACVQYLRQHRIPQTTFLPLDSLQVKPLQEKYRQFVQGASLAVDLVQFDASLLKAIQFVCGDTLICDNLAVARFIVYEKKQPVKAITLDGTVLYKNGLLTGGNAPSESSATAAKWDERPFLALKESKERYQQQLLDLQKQKRKLGDEMQLKNQVTGLRDFLDATQQNKENVQRKLQSLQEEMDHLKRENSVLQERYAAARNHLTQAEHECRTCQERIHQRQDALFASFCGSLQLNNIREYEQQHWQTMQQSAQQALAYTTQLAKLEAQLNLLQQSCQSKQQQEQHLEECLRQWQQQCKEKQDEFNQSDEKWNSLKEQLEQLKKEHEQSVSGQGKESQFGAAKRTWLKAVAQLEETRKQCTAKEVQMEKCMEDRISLLKTCQMEQVELPLQESSLHSEVPFQELDSAALSTLEIDFSDVLEEEWRDINKCQMQLHQVQQQLDLLQPRHVASHASDAAKRLSSTAHDFEQARLKAKQAKQQFAMIQKQRYSLFYEAFRHVAGVVDVIYKQLTRSAAFPLGGTAYLSLENSEEPYLEGIQYHAMPPMKRFRDMEQLSGGEKTVAALALLFALHSFRPAPFFVLDEVDAALDNVNVAKVARYLTQLAKEKQSEQRQSQFIIISLKQALFERCDCLLGVYRDHEGKSSRLLSLDLSSYAQTTATAASVTASAPESASPLQSDAVMI